MLFSKVKLKLPRLQSLVLTKIVFVYKVGMQLLQRLYRQTLNS